MIKVPWAISDVDKHHKGLSAKQKKTWVSVANGALKSCLAKGGKNCDASAIKQANTVVGGMTASVTVTVPDDELTITL